ncbi:MAG: alanyl-tRNA editing protein [Candidatus Thorarchaeota archaeon]|nr:alanyl-tRNA editing protein [Candidatus Thorarchaeota archaeon]
MEKPLPYWINPYRTEFKVTILDVQKGNEGRVEISIDKPVVRPAGGGQAGDRGVLITKSNRIQFVDTRLDGESTIVLANQSPAKNQKATLVVDWDWRYSMMKNHTAEHLFVSQLLPRLSGISISELWIDGEKANLTLQGAKIEEQDLLGAEKRVQKLIEREIKVITELVSSKEVDETVRARKGALGKHKMLRIVSIGNQDESACSGMHVRNTKEIRVFKIVDYSLSNDTAEVKFLTNLSAVEVLAETYNLALQRKHSIPFEMEQLGHILDKYSILQSDHEKMLEKIKSGVEKLVQSHVVGNVTIYHDSLPGFDTKALQEAALNLTPNEPALVLLFSPGDTSYVVVRSVGLEEARFYVGEVVDSLGGKGGGRGDIYTGGFRLVKDPEQLYQKLLTKVEETI